MKHEIKIVIDGEETRLASPEYDCSNIELRKSVIAMIRSCATRTIDAKLSPETTPVVIHEILPNGFHRARFDIDAETGKRKMLA